MILIMSALWFAGAAFALPVPKCCFFEQTRFAVFANPTIKEYYSKSNNVFWGEQLLVNSDISANFDTLLASSIAYGAI